MSKDNEKELKKKEEKKEIEKKKDSEKEEVVTEDSAIREKITILGSYLLEKLKDYRYVIALDFVIFLLLFYLIPLVIFDVKPIVWQIAFVVFTILPTVGIYGMNKFRDKQIIFGFFFIYLLIFLSLKRFTVIELYGISSLGDLDKSPAWLDAVFVTCIILFFQYLGVLIVNLIKKGKKRNKKKSKK